MLSHKSKQLPNISKQLRIGKVIFDQRIFRKQLINAPFVAQRSVQVVQMRVTIAKFNKLTESVRRLESASVKDHIGERIPSSRPSLSPRIKAQCINFAAAVIDILRGEQECIDT